MHLVGAAQRIAHLGAAFEVEEGTLAMRQGRAYRAREFSCGLAALQFFEASLCRNTFQVFAYRVTLDFSKQFF